jgi:hypothetical protein
MTRLLATAATCGVLLLGLAACAGEEDPGLMPGEPAPSAAAPFTGPAEPTLNGEPWDGRVIPDTVQVDLSGGAAYGYTAEVRPFVPRTQQDGDGVTAVTERRLPGCTGPWVRLPIDGEVTDFVADVAREGRYVVARQVTTFPDVETAAQFAPQMQEQPVRCDEVQGVASTSAVRSDYAPDPSLGVPERYDGTAFSQGSATTSEDGTNVRWVDVVSRHRNVVALTRVAEFGHDGEPAVLRWLDEEPRFVELLRSEGARHHEWFSAFDEFRTG